MPPLAAAKPGRRVTESARERETFRYYPSLLSSKYNDDGKPFPNSELLTSHDTILTALAQLGTCQTGTSRALISLFDHERQFIIAEATPNLPLEPSLSHKGRDGEDLWLCGTAIPRGQGACDYTLSYRDRKYPSNSKLPLVLVEDLQADERFKSKPYCRPGCPSKFYAGVPIRTRRGINIGTFCVFSPQAVEWGPRKTDVMRNLSRTIMERLDATKAKTLNRRAERMNRGLGSFVEGRATVTGWQLGPNKEAFKNKTKGEGSLNAKQQLLHEQEDSLATSSNQMGGETFPFPVMVPVSAEGHHSLTDHTSTRRHSISSSINEPEPSINDVFSKAANIVRESLEIEGCLFLDAAVGSFGPAEANTPATSNRMNDRSEASETSDGEARYSSCDGSQGPPNKCKVLGFSTTDSSSIDGGQALPRHGAMQVKFLLGLLRRYPKGRIFDFDDGGELQSSDSSEGASSGGSQPATSPPLVPTPGMDLDPLSPVSAADPKKHSVRRIGKGSEGIQLLQIFPGARSVAFVPVWDSRKERWCAGGFIYTHTATRVFTTEGELSYMRAFGMLAMAETLWCETRLSERAKTDALSSLSHEIRSPLHGIVLGVELMRDTELTVFQGNITHTIETCCRTLIDTVDHLLDYSKINNFKTGKRNQKHSSAPRGLRLGSSKSIQSGMKSLSTNVRLDALTEEVIESIFAGFNFQHISIAQLVKQRTVQNADISANRQMDAMRAMEDLDPSRTPSGDIQLTFGDASIFILIDHSCSWEFYTQPGAIRRIIMNLFGNSLKHTQKGTIRVILKQTPSKRHRNERLVSIIVADSGRGISQDYLRNELFKPFSQEDALAPGSGLGLSIVKKITTQLRGRISVASIVGTGTTVTVALPMITTSRNTKLIQTDDDIDFTKLVQQLRGLRVRLLGFDENRTAQMEESGSAFDDQELNGHRLIRTICRDWLHMEVISGLQAEDLASDLVLWSESALPHGTAPDELTKPPCIVVCANALVAYQRSTAPGSADRSGVFEFISQPVGPRKLAKILMLALDRWIVKQVAQPVTLDETLFPTETSPSGVGVTVESSKPGLPIISRPPLAETTLTPPTSQDDAPISTQDQPPPPVSPSTDPTPAPTPAPVPKIEFLLVDDNAINLKILSTYLRKLGLAYHTATNGQEALDVFKRDPAQCRVVFMDISMPVMDGFEATRHIRAYEAELKKALGGDDDGDNDQGLPPAAIFALSGLASSSAQQEAFWSGVDLFLTKPVKLKELGSILRERGMLKP